MCRPNPEINTKKLHFTSILLAVIFLNIPAILSAQDRPYKNQIKVSPLRAVDLVNPGLELSYERRFSNTLSAEFAGAYMTAPFMQQHFPGYKGYRVSFGPKYFIDRTEYASPEFAYHKVTFDEVTSGVDTIRNMVIADTFLIRKKMISINIRYGKQFFFNHFLIDLAIGFGFKYRNVQHEGRTVEYLAPRHPNIYYSAKQPRKDWTMNFPIQFKIGYRF
jgi:hypothetical protein